VVAGSVLLATGGGLYMTFGMPQSALTDAPVLTASVEPVKQAADPVINTEGTARSVVFDQIEGEAPLTGAEQLVSRDETAGATGNEVSRVIASDGVGEGGLANRKVRTVTVRPDGTIVSGDEAVAGTEMLPVARPNVPDLQVDRIETGDLMADPVADLLQSSEVGGAGTTTSVASASAPMATTENGESFPMPRPRPASRAAPPPQPATSAQAAAAPAPAAPAALPLAPAEQPAAPSDFGNGALDLMGALDNEAGVEPAGFDPASGAAVETASLGSGAPAYVQLVSQRTEQAAQQSKQEMQQRFGMLFGGSDLEIQRIDLAGKGTFYRVLLPAGSMAEANSICSSVKSAGGDCVIPTT
jgi:hypothetical protein